MTLHLSDIVYSYNDSSSVLNKISFNIPKGQVVSILGKSGCGKTTLLNLIAGIFSPLEGSISNNGSNLAYLTQKPTLLKYRNSFENAILGLELRNSITNNSVKNIKDLFVKFGIEDSVSMFPTELSGGMRQRVGLIQTFSIMSDLYLLDEPFTAIDRNTLKNIGKYIWSKFKANGSSSIIVTHDIEQALLMSDRIIMLSSNPGTIVFDKTYPEDFCEIEPALRKNHSYFSNYLLEIVKEFGEL